MAQIAANRGISFQIIYICARLLQLEPSRGTDPVSRDAPQWPNDGGVVQAGVFAHSANMTAFTLHNHSYGTSTHGASRICLNCRQKISPRFHGILPSSVQS